MKRMKEKEVENIDHQLISVMDMVNNIEWEATNLQVMKALKEGNSALNKLHNEMSYEDVVNLLDETNEAIEVKPFIVYSSYIILMFFLLLLSLD
jgi:charged multivesicular body protein 6